MTLATETNPTHERETLQARPRHKPLRDQTIVITGASSGIGKATAERAARMGANLVLAARDEGLLRELHGSLEAQGAACVYICADVGVEADVARIVNLAQTRFGGFDTWVNNAGVGVYGELTNVPLEDQMRVFQTNYWGVVNGSLAAIAHFRARGVAGTLINIGSIVSDVGAPLLGAYAASKHAVKGFTDTLRMELLHAGDPIRVTLIKPSGVDTPFDAHAKNYLPHAAKLPDPLYSPDLVARTILHAATHAVREITVGWSGKQITLFAKAAPGAADRVLPRTLYRMQQDENAPKAPRDSLHAPSGDNRIYSDHSQKARFSLYTAARLHPAATASLIAVSAATAFLAWRSIQKAKEIEQQDDGQRYPDRPENAAFAHAVH